MANIFDRLAEGPDAMQESDYSDWSEMIGSAPPDRFHRAAHQAIRQVPADEYRRHVTPGIDGTDPLGRLQPQQRSGIIQSLLGALFGNGAAGRGSERWVRVGVRGGTVTSTGGRPLTWSASEPRLSVMMARATVWNRMRSSSDIWSAGLTKMPPGRSISLASTPAAMRSMIWSWSCCR